MIKIAICSVVGAAANEVNDPPPLDSSLHLTAYVALFYQNEQNNWVSIPAAGSGQVLGVNVTVDPSAKNRVIEQSVIDSVLSWATNPDRTGPSFSLPSVFLNASEGDIISFCPRVEA
jgi:hypothetical protein